MNTKEVQALESYFKTENKHWNGYALKNRYSCKQQKYNRHGEV
jgi:hypothetical protein